MNTQAAMTTQSHNQRKELIIFLPDRYDTVLEIGCGEGGFVEAYSSARERWGIEPSRERGSKAASKLTQLFLETYQDVQDRIPDRYFDLIVCNDVIEHMPDHDAFLHSIKQKMKPDGVIVGSIPNVRYYRNLQHLLFEKDWHYQGKGIRDTTHLRFFTEKSLLRTFETHGFSIEMFQGINPSNMASLRLRLFFKILGWMVHTTYSDVRYQQFGFRLHCRTE